MDDKPEHVRCARCGAVRRYGDDLVAVTRGVLGPRGFVPVEEPELFCGEGCVAGSLQKEPVEKLHRRIP